MYQRSFDTLSNREEWRKAGMLGFGEFAGTTAFLWLAFAGQTFAQNSSTSLGSDVINTSSVLFIALVYGFSYAMTLWIFLPMSGGFFNPAITLALTCVGGMPLARCLVFIVMQFAGGIVAAWLVAGMMPGKILAQTLKITTTTLVQGTFIEAFLTTLLIMTVFMLSMEKTRSRFLAPVGVGLSLFVANLAGYFWTGASVNPARSLGPAIAGRLFYRFHWIYYVGPLIGVFMSWALYETFKVTSALSPLSLLLLWLTVVQAMGLHEHLREMEQEHQAVKELYAVSGTGTRPVSKEYRLDTRGSGGLAGTV